MIAGTILVVLQLRVNAKNVRSRNAFDLITKVIDPSFAQRRHRLYEVGAKHADGDWAGFDRSLQDFEVRNFANIYEQLGLLARRGVIDLQDLLDALSAQPFADWVTFQPIRAHIMSEAGKAYPALNDNQPGLDAVFWPNFRWLAEESPPRLLSCFRGCDGQLAMGNRFLTETSLLIEKARWTTDDR